MKVRVSKGIYYFPTFQSARAYAVDHGLRTDRIISYEKGWAVQLRVSGDYAGPNKDYSAYRSNPKRINKWIWGWKFYCNYGQGWEYEIFEATREGMKENKKAYLENSPYPLKITYGKEINPEWENQQHKTNRRRRS